VHTLERKQRGGGRLRQATLFYFTDNLVTYYIVSSGSSGSPELQKLIRRLKSLKLELSIRLEVVHIPDTHMIDQWTDGLSRGIRLAGGQFKCSPGKEVLHIFEGVPLTLGSASWTLAAARSVCQHAHIQVMDSTQHRDFCELCGCATLWFPAPEWAHQLLDCVVTA
jgi:hypothetical protein